MSVRTQVRQWLKRTLDGAGCVRGLRRGSRTAVEALERRTLLSAVQIDFSGVFNQDSIRNRTGGVDDITDTTVDGGALLVTDAYAQNQSPSGNGLPNNGTFAANTHHPHIQLGYSNDNNGKNVVLLEFPGTEFTVPVPAETYDRIDLLAMSVLGASNMDVTLNYSDGTVTGSTLVEDWFDEVTEGNTEGDAIPYYLIDGMDRWDGDSFADVDDPAVFGFRFPVDPARVLQSITVTHNSSHSIGSGLVVLGATANTTRYIVDSLDGSSDGDFSPGNFSLREAIELANASSTVNPDVITFAPFLTGTISITSELLVTDNVRIIGPGASRLSVGGGNTATRIFHVNNSDASLINVAISGLTIRDAGDGTTEIFGAGLLSVENLTLQEVAVLNNDSATTGGGGIAISAGSLLLMSSLVSGNRANQGGGIEVSFSAGSATIINSTISGNSAKSFGGGIEVVVGTATIRNSTITGNRSDIDNSGNENGGGVDGNAGLITLHNSIVADNFQGTGSVASDVGNTLVGSSSFNLIGDAGSAGGLTNGLNGNIVGNSGAGTRNINTILNTTLASNGGPTLTHALVTGSPAIDRGSNAAAVNVANGNAPLTADQRGVPFTRILDGDHLGAAPAAIVDMGAFEFSGLRLTSPSPNTFTLRPTFTWNPIAGATSYRIQINNESTDVAQYHLASPTGTSYTPLANLAIGKFRMWIRPVFGVTLGNWSPPQLFNNLTAPTWQSMQRTQLTSRPTLLWNALPGAVKYDLWVDNFSTRQSQLIRQDVTGTSFTPATDLPMGIYRFWIRGVDAKGNFANWSVLQEFLVVPGPTPVGPLSGTFDRTPTFAWNPVAGAVSYELYVRNQNTGTMVINGQSIAATSFTPVTNLADGQYRWWTIAVSPAGIGPIKSGGSNPTDIYIGGRPTILAPAAGSSTSDRTPTFSWQAVDGAASYRLQVNRIDVPQAGIISLEGRISTSFTPTTNLPAGTFRAWVRAVSSTGELSPWSIEVNFTVTDLDAADPAERSEYRLAALLVSGLAHEEHTPFGTDQSRKTSREAAVSERMGEPLDGPSIADNAASCHDLDRLMIEFALQESSATNGGGGKGAMLGSPFSFDPS